MKKPNISGIIHNIILFVCACLGSAEGIVVIFCVSHMEMPTSTGITGVGSGSDKSTQRNELFIGITSLTLGSQEYKC